MPASTTTFEERIARIHQRAAQGDMVGFVQPGVAEEAITPRAAKKLVKQQSKRRGGYVASILGGLVTSFAIVGIGTVVLMGGVGEDSFEAFAASILLSSE